MLSPPATTVGWMRSVLKALLVRNCSLRLNGSCRSPRAVSPANRSHCHCHCHQHRHYRCNLSNLESPSRPRLALARPTIARPTTEEKPCHEKQYRCHHLRKCVWGGCIRSNDAGPPGTKWQHAIRSISAFCVVLFNRCEFRQSELGNYRRKEAEGLPRVRGRKVHVAGKTRKGNCSRRFAGNGLSRWAHGNGTRHVYEWGCEPSDHGNL